MVISCYVCKKRQNDKNSGISFHVFPKATMFRSAWEKACKLEEPAPKRARVCSEHFTQDDFMPKREYGVRLLKRSAIPSAFVWNQEANLITNSNNVEGTFIHIKTKPTTSTSTLKQNKDCAVKVASPSCKTMISLNNECHSPKTPSTRDIDVQCNLCLSETSSVQTLQEMEASNISNKICSPARIEDLTPEHFSTPRRASQNLQFIKQKTDEKLIKIKCLQTENIKLLKRIASLQDLISYLRKNNFISESIARGLMDYSMDSTMNTGEKMQQQEKIQVKNGKKRCCVRGCPSKDIRMFTFPSSETNNKRMLQWVEACGRPDLWLLPFEKLKFRSVCCLHFEQKYFLNKKLSTSAVPTRHLPGPATFKTEPWVDNA